MTRASTSPACRESSQVCESETRAPSFSPRQTRRRKLETTINTLLATRPPAHTSLISSSLSFASSSTVYNGEIGEAKLLGTVKVGVNTTVGDVRTAIAERYASSPSFSLKKRTTPIKRSADNATALDYFGPGDYVITQEQSKETTPAK